MTEISKLSPQIQDGLLLNAVGQMESMRSYRLSFWAHWAKLAELFLPRRYRWFVTPNQLNRGAMMNQAIVDETGVIAARTLASGLLSGLTSPTKPWFRLGIHGLDTSQPGPVRKWLAKCEATILKVYGESNFYTALGVNYHDNGVFGSAAMIQYEDDEDIVRFINPCLGEFFFGVSKRLTVDTLAREYTYTVKQCVQEFGLEACSASTQASYKAGGASRELEVVICHIIEPNVEVWVAEQSLGLPVSKLFTYRELYWERTGTPAQKQAGTLLRLRGFREKPFTATRWDVTSNDPYGRSPGMDALPANIQLQIEQRRKAEGIEKQVRPPMVGSVSMRNEPADITPGGLTYVSDLKAEGFKPAFMVQPDLQYLIEDVKEVQARIEAIFFTPLFLMISQLDTVRTATEIDARREEKLIQLGPVIERFENEVLDPIIDRTFAICSRRGLFPPAPAEIQGKPIQVQYISMLAEAQRAASTAAIERLLQVAGNLVGVVPDIMDNLKTDEMIEEYANLLNIKPDLIRAMKDVLVIRKARTAAQQQAAALQTGQGLAESAQTLSQTDVGGGKNALQAMMGAS